MSELSTVLLEAATALESDLLISGAYPTGFIREMIFGGPTDHLFHRAQIPVLLACEE